jgi:hypothetical protein
MEVRRAWSGLEQGPTPADANAAGNQPAAEAMVQLTGYLGSTRAPCPRPGIAAGTAPVPDLDRLHTSPWVLSLSPPAAQRKRFRFEEPTGGRVIIPPSPWERTGSRQPDSGEMGDGVGAARRGARRHRSVVFFPWTRTAFLAQALGSCGLERGGAGGVTMTAAARRSAARQQRSVCGEGLRRRPAARRRAARQSSHGVMAWVGYHATKGANERPREGEKGRGADCWSGQAMQINWNKSSKLQPANSMSGRRPRRWAL